MKTFIIGDIHGGLKSLKQCLGRSKFNYNKDKLICIGDTCDGWPETKQCFDELLKIKDLIYIIGNHDAWFLRWALFEENEQMWIQQGGQATQESYRFDHETVSSKHTDLLVNKAKNYYIEEKNRLFVHGGINPVLPIEYQSRDNLMWDRELMRIAHEREHYAGYHQQPRKVTKYEEVFIGHTPTTFYYCYTPMHVCEVWNVDTGGGYEGKLSIMDVDTKEYWQSDKLNFLYPGYRGR